VAALHAELPRYELVVWTAGNVSERVPGTEAIDGGLFVIKPSGVSYDDLTPESMVVCTLDGTKIVDGTPDRLTPSSDTAAHAYVYRAMPEVNGQVHTHSPYAAAWAARGEQIPCVLTAMADEFGGPIPVGPFALIGDDSIGQGIVGTLQGSRSPAVLMQNHGASAYFSNAPAIAHTPGTYATEPYVTRGQLLGKTLINALRTLARFSLRRELQWLKFRHPLFLKAYHRLYSQ